jgi:hypothetical protein
MPTRPRRSPQARLLLIVAALGTLIAGYYLGQYWQRSGLDGLSAVVYRDGQIVAYPQSLGLDSDRTDTPWRLFVAADTRVADCQKALRRFGLMMNRLAAWPGIQPRVRVSVLAYDQPNLTSAERTRGGAPWLEVITAPVPDLDRLSSSLGILPDPARWCSPAQLNSILVEPDRRRWALIPFEDPQTMAHNVQAVIQFVE